MQWRIIAKKQGSHSHSFVALSPSNFVNLRNECFSQGLSASRNLWRTWLICRCSLEGFALATAGLSALSSQVWMIWKSNVQTADGRTVGRSYTDERTNGRTDEGSDVWKLVGTCMIEMRDRCWWSLRMSPLVFLSFSLSLSRGCVLPYSPALPLSLSLSFSTGPVLSSLLHSP